MSKRKTISKSLYTPDYKRVSMSKEIGFVIVGFIDSPEQANEITGILKLAKLGQHIQDLNKGV